SRTAADETGSHAPRGDHRPRTHRVRQGTLSEGYDGPRELRPDPELCPLYRGGVCRPGPRSPAPLASPGSQLGARLKNVSLAFRVVRTHTLRITRPQTHPTLRLRHRFTLPTLCQVFPVRRPFLSDSERGGRA